MKKIKNNADSTYMLILERGEEVISTLTAWAKETNVTGGIVQGIGALEDVTLGYYDLKSKNYDRKHFSEEYELLNLSGNFSSVEGEIFCHLHAQLSDAEYRCIGGHLFSGKVAITAEIFIQPISANPVRKLDPEIGLNLIVKDGFGE